MNSNNGHKKTNNGPIVLKNTPHDNWLLWNFKKGKETKNKLNPCEVKLLKLKEDIDKLQKQIQKDCSWFNGYKNIVVKERL